MADEPAHLPELPEPMSQSDMWTYNYELQVAMNEATERRFQRLIHLLETQRAILDDQLTEARKKLEMAQYNIRNAQENLEKKWWDN